MEEVEKECLSYGRSSGVENRLDGRRKVPTMFNNVCLLSNDLLSCYVLVLMNAYLCRTRRRVLLDDNNSGCCKWLMDGMIANFKEKIFRRRMINLTRVLKS